MSNSFCPVATPAILAQENKLWLCQIKFRIQARQVRKAHVDAHYTLGLFRYQREFAIRYREYCTFVSMDDKHRVKFGEPEYPVAGVERGKQVLLTATKTLAVADHDFTKTPSVTFIITIPDCILGSFYTGRVFVGVKENIFQPSSPIGHMAELQGACVLLMLTIHYYCSTLMLVQITGLPTPLCKFHW